MSIIPYIHIDLSTENRVVTINYLKSIVHIYRGRKSKFIFQNLAVNVKLDSIKLKIENYF